MLELNILSFYCRQMHHILGKYILQYFQNPHSFPQPSLRLVLEIDYDSLERSLCSAQIARKIDTLTLQVEWKIYFIVLDCLSKTHSSRILYEVIMALFKYFKKVEHTVSDSAQASGLKEVEENEVQKQFQSISEPQSKKKRQRGGNYHKIQRAEIAKWGIVHGVRPAAKKFGVPESTVRGIIKNYKEAKVENEELRELPRKDRGAKTLLPFELDDKVLQMIKNMRPAGCVVNYSIVIAIGKGIALANDRTLLKENGGNLNIDFSWCQSIFQRIGFTKRRATTATQPVSPDFLKEMGFSFHRAIKEVVDAYEIPDDQVITSTNHLCHLFYLANTRWIKRMKNLCQ